MNIFYYEYIAECSVFSFNFALKLTFINDNE